jgi:hypothetical protein
MFSAVLMLLSGIRCQTASAVSRAECSPEIHGFGVLGLTWDSNPDGVTTGSQVLYRCFVQAKRFEPALIPA